MSVCDLNSALIQIQRATKQLQDHWFTTQATWNDAVSREFQSTHLEPILPELRITINAAHELSELFDKGEKACRDPNRSTGLE